MAAELALRRAKMTVATGKMTVWVPQVEAPTSGMAVLAPKVTVPTSKLTVATLKVTAAV